MGELLDVFLCEKIRSMLGHSLGCEDVYSILRLQIL